MGPQKSSGHLVYLSKHLCTKGLSAFQKPPLYSRSPKAVTTWCQEADTIQAYSLAFCSNVGQLDSVSLCPTPP